jgi:PAS domain S-box-containing protein
VKFSSLKLSAKALLIVALLLLVECLFVGSYFFLLHKAEEEAAKQEKAKLIVARTNDLITVLFEGGFSIQQNIFNKEQADLSKFSKAQMELPADIAWLRQQVGADPEQLKLLARIDERTGKAMVMLEKMKTISEREAPMVAVNYAIKLRTKLQKQMEGLVQDLIDFMNVEKKIASESPAAIKQKRDYLRWLLLVALLINILAAIALALVFVRSITSRLEVVVENSDLLRRRGVLRAPMSGKDEIAQLDRAFHDMSTSLRGEEELVRASELQLRAMIDQMPIGLMIIADREKIEYANPTLERLLAYQKEELVGLSLSQLFTLPGAVEKSFHGDGIAGGVVELLGRKKNGSELHVEYSVVDVSLGAKSRRLAIVIDITERHEVEKMRKAFVAMVSHDLRTPLTSVAGFLQLLPMGVYGELTAPAVGEVNLAEGQVEQLIMLINDLLDLEKLEAGKLEMSRSEVVLEDVIDSALDTVFSLAEIRQVELMFEGCEIEVLADGERLKQAFSKILSCMLRICSQGDTLDILVEPEAKSGAAVVKFRARKLTLPQENLASIFEPFQRLKLASFDGSLGLGLTLARAIMLQHGGTCRAIDEEVQGKSHGTTLALQLPRREV